jgi:creatinine amidohydrolase/Fe(II)-dependent formamide hydrolase-like protein
VSLSAFFVPLQRAQRIWNIATATYQSVGIHGEQVNTSEMQQVIVRLFLWMQKYKGLLKELKNI